MPVRTARSPYLRQSDAARVSSVDARYDTDSAKKILLDKFQKIIAALEEKGVQIIQKDVRIVEKADILTLEGSLKIQLQGGVWQALSIRTRQKNRRLHRINMAFTEQTLELDNAHISNLFGQFDCYLKKLERAFGTQIIDRDVPSISAANSRQLPIRRQFLPNCRSLPDAEIRYRSRTWITQLQCIWKIRKIPYLK